MVKDKKRLSPYSIGSCSILLIFITICLTTFAALSLVSANSDYKMSIKTAENTAEYYLADSKAQVALANLHKIVNNNLQEEDFLSSCFREISHDKLFMADKVNSKIYITYNIPVNDRQYLQAVVIITEENPKQLSIESWKVITKADDSEESPLNVWDGGLY